MPEPISLNEFRYRREQKTRATATAAGDEAFDQWLHDQLARTEIRWRNGQFELFDEYDFTPIDTGARERPWIARLLRVFMGKS